MKRILLFCFIAFFSTQIKAQGLIDTAAEHRSLDKNTDAIRAAFAKKDVDLVVALHSPDIVKYFGGKNVISGRSALRQNLTGWFNSSKSIEFIQNTVESTAFAGNVAVQTVIFAIRTTPANGAPPVISRGRSMLVFVQDKSSPTGWLTLREITQEAP